MFGPALSGPARLVNRDVPVCDEQAYKAAGYKRGSIAEEAQVLEGPKAAAKNLSLGTEELPTEEPDPVIETESVAAVPVEQPAKPRRKKGQN
jgi:hypothetical protein